MIENKKQILPFIIGALAMLLVFFAWKKISTVGEKDENTDFYIITNQIRKMNKMVVMEQDFSSMQKTTTSYNLPGGLSRFTELKIITFTKTNAQVSYDLNKMKLEVDSIGKKLIIKELPDPEVKIIPSVEITSVDESMFGNLDEKSIKKITNSAKTNAIKQVNQKSLILEGRKQLTKNLDQIFVLAKALNYTIEDRTGTIDTLKL